jgi:hypothetical protein
MTREPSGKLFIADGGGPTAVINHPQDKGGHQ